MQLTRAADYAIRVMIHLAGLPPGARVSRSELSMAAECPEQFLCKVLQNLTRAGLVNSYRGNTGGFELEQLHRTASILAVVEAIEGPIRLNLCLASDRACTRQGGCPTHGVWATAQATLRQVLQEANIADLALRAATQQRPASVAIDAPFRTDLDRHFGQPLDGAGAFDDTWHCGDEAATTPVTR